MSETEFDTIVIGAGLAGLCCAGELVLRGQRPLLISETKEVGSTFATKKLGENGESTAWVQHITWQTQWGGGWWFQLARELNLPLRLYPGVEFEIRVQGTGQTIHTPVCVSPAALTEVICDAFPLPEESRGNLESVLTTAMAIPYEDLIEMHRVPLGTWLEEQGADEIVATVILALCGQLNDLRVEQARRYQSVFGGIGILRLILGGEGTLPIIYPNIREGLCIPLAKEIERRGGEVWRGRRVNRILVEDGRANGVEFTDGQIVRAPNVAVAAGNPRIRALLDPLPPEVVEPLSYTDDIDMADFNQYYLLDKTVVDPPRDRMAAGTFNPESMSVVQLHLVMTSVAPWTTEPGKQLVLGHTAMPRDEVAALGGDDAVYKRMLELSEEHYPGLTDAIVDTAQQSHKHHWFTPICVGPKLPRSVESTPGLWFVGDGSRPCAGIWTEAAASCGILGARAILESA